MPHRLSANTGFLFKDRPFLDRIVAAGRAGFDAVEFHDEWREESVTDIRAALREAGGGRAPLAVVGLNARMGDTAGRAALAGEENAARQDAAEAIDMASALDARGVHLLAGKTDATDEALAAYRDNLAYACVLAGEAGRTILIEPLSQTAMATYPLRTVGQTAELIEVVGRSELRVMFDIYHVHQEGDPLVETLRTHAGVVGHVQIADPETRNEPKAEGPYAIARLLARLAEAGYDGPFGCEYRPLAGTEEGLDWRATL